MIPTIASNVDLSRRDPKMYEKSFRDLDRKDKDKFSSEVNERVTEKIYDRTQDRNYERLNPK